jgi:hypothetical protein
MTSRAVLFGALAVLAVTTCPGSSVGAAEPAPLFASNRPLEVTLSVPVRRLVARARSRPEVAGKVSYTDSDGRLVELDVKVSTRGKSRLEYCRFPPLALNFKRRQLDNTLFAGQNKLKLVTRCRDGGNFEQYLALERVLYGVYEQLTDVAFRTRPAQMRYVDTERDEVTEAPAFLLEHKDGVAKRFGMKAVDVPRLAIADIRPESLATLGLFQFVIGNTDWSAIVPSEDEKDCCHNGAVLVTTSGPEEVIVVPYDFDQAGIINAVYAAPSLKVPIRSVRQRYYWGLCASNPFLDDAIDQLNSARTAIEALFEDPAIDDRTRANALGYLRDAYAIVNDPKQRQSQVIDRCRGH